MYFCDFFLYFHLFANGTINIIMQFADHYHHTRGSLTDKIKNAVYQVFSSKKLPTVGGLAE
jgi:hypothetical protein